MVQRMHSDTSLVDYGSSVGRSFIDKLILAIIDAHPNRDLATDVKRTQDRNRRLKVVKENLFGEASPEGRPQDPVNLALRWMATQRFRDVTIENARREPEPPAWAREEGWKARSTRNLADEATLSFGLLREQAESLRKKFGEREQALLDIEYFHDDVPETLEFNALQQIATLLRNQGIDTRLDRIEHPNATTPPRRGA